MRRALVIEARSDKFHRALRHRPARPEQDRRGRGRGRARAGAQPEQSRRHQSDGPHRLRARRSRSFARPLSARAGAQARSRRRLQQHGQRAQGARPAGRSARRPISRRCGSIRTSPASTSTLPIQRNSRPAIRISPPWRRSRRRPKDLSKTDRMQLDFALGKAYADLKDYRALVRAPARRQCGQARDDRLRRDIAPSLCSTGSKRCSRAN